MASICPKFSVCKSGRVAKFAGRSFTWAELAEKINQVEAFLLQQGVTEQSAVAFCGKNSEKILFLYLAVIQLGAKILGINPVFPQEKREELSHVYGVDFCYQTEDIHYLAAEVLPEHTADFRKAATMTLTSGSTGLPKAAVHNMSAHLANAEGVLCLNEFWQRAIVATFFAALSCFRTRHCVALALRQVATLVYRKKIFINLLVRFLMFLSCQHNYNVGLIIWPNILNRSKRKRYYWGERKSLLN